MVKKVWLGLFVVVAAYACGDAAGDLMGGALQDAGSMMQDAGEQMQDGGAQAQESKAVTCDRTFTRTHPESGTSSDQKYALVDVGGKGFPDVSYRTTYRSGGGFLQCPSEEWTCAGGPSGKATTWSHVWEYREGKAVIPCSGNEESITVYY